VDIPANKGTALFCPFQLNPHRYTLSGGSVSTIRSRVRKASLFGDNRISRICRNSRLARLRAIRILTIRERIVLTIDDSFPATAN